MSKKIENAIIINGKVYELVEDLGEDECERCALRDDCHYCADVLCVTVFSEVKNKRFEERSIKL